MFGKRKANTGTLQPWQEKVSQKIASVINRIQHRWAAWMNQVVNRLSLKGKKLALFCFCLFMGALSALSIANWGVIKSSGTKIDTKINLPRSMLPAPQTTVILPRASADRIKHFRTYLDSLGKSERGIGARDSLLKSRPGLLDSIEKVEQYYELQLNNH